LKGKSPKKKPINWGGVFLLALFAIPSLFAAAIYAYDYFNPQVRSAADRQLT
jgi:hypothetical protein